jgi:hypothetical protein
MHQDFDEKCSMVPPRELLGKNRFSFEALYHKVGNLAVFNLTTPKKGGGNMQQQTYDDSKVDKALNYITMFSNLDQAKQFYGLSSAEYDELRQRARARYGDAYG